MTADLFVYGAFLQEELVAGLLGRRPRRVRAVLPGYRKARVPGRTYDEVLPEGDAEVPGDLLVGLVPDDLAVLDRFEAPYGYGRTAVRVRVDGRPRDAEVYVRRGGAGKP